LDLFGACDFGFGALLKIFTNLELYNNNIMSKPLKLILLSTLFGLASGIVGGLISSAYISPNRIIVLGGEKEKVVEEKNNTEEKILETYKKLLPTVLDIYLEKPVTKDPLGQIYLEKDRVALGVILTSDGWVATRGKSFADSKNRFAVVTNDKKIFTPQKTIFDETSGIYFLKIEVENLPVPELGTYDDLSLGEKIIFPAEKHSFGLAEIKTIPYKKIADPKDLLLSSERSSKLVLLGGKSAISAPLFDLNGKLIGLSPATSGEENIVMPANFWQKNFLDLIKNEKIKQPYLGVNYLDLANSPGLKENFNQNKTAGALIASDKASGIVGVIKNSPAEIAGLKDGDIILKINSDEITQKTDLAEIVRDYTPGAKIQVIILREGKEIVLEVELGEK